MKSFALIAVMSSVMVTGSAFADSDFRALGQVSNLTPMSEKQLASVDGGHACGGGLINVGNVCANVAVPTVFAINVGLLGGARQNITQVTKQSIH